MYAIKLNTNNIQLKIGICQIKPNTNNIKIQIRILMNFMYFVEYAYQ